MTTSKLLRGLIAGLRDTRRTLLSGSENAPSEIDLCQALIEGIGEASELAIAQEILKRYEAMDDSAKVQFFKQLDPLSRNDDEQLAQAVDNWRNRPGPHSRRRLHDASEPVTQDLLRRMNRASGATRSLVNMRADLLQLLKAHPELRSLDSDFLHLFKSWFNRGFLEIRRIDWSASAETLERVIAYEAVHEIQSWDDLRRRVATPDRRLYAFFHPAMGSDPLIFVEVALTREIPAAIGPILAGAGDPIEPETATTAVFYSISNCQPGLRGVSFGNFLIKQVVEELRRDIPEIANFVTLSPVPGLRNWAREEAENTDGLLSEDLRASVIGGAPGSRHLKALAALYLLKTRSTDGGALDPVARFHLGNGARLDAIHTDADNSPNGLKGSWGVMVNYVYAPGQIVENHERYLNRHEIVCSSAVRRHLPNM